MPHAGVYVLASLISGVSAALILASGPSYTESRSPEGTVYNVKRGQSTYDGCRAGPCQIVYLNSVEDFCLWAPSQPVLSVTRNTEHTLVAWCMKSAHGARLIPDGTISGARFVVTPEYVQITGAGNLTNINVPAKRVASASGEGDRVHDLVFTNAYGQLEQIYDWTSSVSQERFCFRVCRPSAAASTACPEIHGIIGCSEYVSENYDTGVFEDCIGDATEVHSALYQEVLAAPSHHSAHLPSSCTTMANAQVTRARRAIAPILVTSLSRWHFRSHSHSTPTTPPVVPTTTDTATTITFSSFLTLTSSATTFMNSSTPVSSNDPTLTPNSYNHTSHWHSHTHSLSHHYTSTSSASASSSSSHHSFSHSPSSSSTASSPNDPSLTSLASSSPISSTPSYTLTYSSSEPSSSGTPTSFVPIPTPASMPMPTSSFPSSYGTFSSFPGVPSSPSSSYHDSTPSSGAAPTLSPTSYSISPQSSYVLTFTTPSSSSVPTTSPASSSPTDPNSQTQIGSQCPLLIAVNAGSVVPSFPLLPLMLTILMIAISSSVGVLVL